MVNTKTVPISMDPEDFMFMKKNGISRSEFMRQALQHYKEGKFPYDKSKQR